MKVLFLSLAIILSLNKPASAMDEGWSTQAIVATAIGSGGLVAACCGMCVACCSGYGFSCFDSCKDYMASYGIGFFQNTGLGRINQTLESGFNRLAQNKDEIKKIKDELKNLRIEVSSLSNDYSRKNNTIEDLCDNNTNVAERSYDVDMSEVDPKDFLSISDIDSQENDQFSHQSSESLPLDNDIHTHENDIEQKDEETDTTIEETLSNDDKNTSQPITEEDPIIKSEEIIESENKLSKTDIDCRHKHKQQNMHDNAQESMPSTNDTEKKKGE